MAIKGVVIERVVQAERKFESEKTEGTDFHRVEHWLQRIHRLAVSMCG